MTIPDTLNIMGTGWRVIKLGRMEDVDPDGSELLWGHCNRIRREIRVYMGGDPADTLQSFMHELTHAILDELHMKESENEQWVDVFSRALTDTLTRNAMVTTEDV